MFIALVNFAEELPKVLFAPSRITPRIMVFEGKTIAVNCQTEAIYEFIAVSLQDRPGAWLS
jgi:hypothetical protein